MKTTRKPTANKTTRTKRPARTPAKSRRPKLKIKRILVPLDFSEHAEKALHYAVKFAEQFDARIDLVSVVEPVIYAEGMAFPAGAGNPDENSVQESGKALRELAEREIPDDLSWKALVRRGNPYAEIIDTARDQKTELLIITTHGRTGLTHFLIGSTAEKIVRHAPCPVLVVRDKEHDFI